MNGSTEPGQAFVPFALERWFATQPRDWNCDLSSSGATALALDELLAFASPSEREEFARSSLGYGPADGSERLRSLIAERYVGVRASDVIVTCGAIEALHLSISALVSPGDEVIVQWPSYPAVAGLARMYGARVVPWKLDEDRGYRSDNASLKRLLTSKTRVVAITQPNNPTGSLLEREELDALTDLVDSVGAYLLSDEVYRDLVLEPGLYPDSATERSSRAISIGDVAKPFGLGGLRIGWLVARDAGLRERIRARRDYTTLSTPTPSDVLARVALSHSAELLRTPVANARENLRALAALAPPEPGLALVPPRAGLTAFARFVGATVLQKRLAADGILVVPGTLFGCPDRLRIWLGGSIAEFAPATEAITRHLADPSPSRV